MWTWVTTQLNQLLPWLPTKQQTEARVAEIQPGGQAGRAADRAGPKGQPVWGLSSSAVTEVGPVFGLLAFRAESVGWGVWSFCSDRKSPTLKMPESFSPSLHERWRARSLHFPVLRCAACRERGTSPAGPTGNTPGNLAISTAAWDRWEGGLTSLEEVKFALQVVEHLHCQLKTEPERRENLYPTAQGQHFTCPVPYTLCCCFRPSTWTHTHTHARQLQFLAPN